MCIKLNSKYSQVSHSVPRTTKKKEKQYCCTSNKTAFYITENIGIGCFYIHRILTVQLAAL